MMEIIGDCCYEDLRSWHLILIYCLLDDTDLHTFRKNKCLYYLYVLVLLLKNFIVSEPRPTAFLLCTCRVCLFLCSNLETLVRAGIQQEIINPWSYFKQR